MPFKARTTRRLDTWSQEKPITSQIGARKSKKNNIDHCYIKYIKPKSQIQSSNLEKKPETMKGQSDPKIRYSNRVSVPSSRLDLREQSIGNKSQTGLV